MASKAELRVEMRTRLRELGARRDPSSQALCAALISRPEYAQARTVAIFDPLKSEPDVSKLWQLAPRTFVYPRIVDETLQFFSVADPSELETAPGVPFREPALDPERAVPLSQIDLILVPGLAFTLDGHRLGRGGGYYDRLLAVLPSRAARIGVCFSFQVVPGLPMENHDELVDAVVTD